MMTATWTRADATTFVADASELGLAPGVKPSSLSLPERCESFLASEWIAEVTDDEDRELISWSFEQHGFTFIIFND